MRASLNNNAKVDREWNPIRCYCGIGDESMATNATVADDGSTSKQLELGTEHARNK